jgi:hypothetical protein
MGTLTTELPMRNWPENPSFQRIQSSGLTSVKAAPPAGRARYCLFSYRNRAVDDVDLELEYVEAGGVVSGDSGRAQDEGGSSFLPILLMPGDGDLRVNITSGGPAYDLHWNMSGVDVPFTDFPVVDHRPSGITPVKVLDGPSSPNLARRVVSILPQIGGPQITFSQPVQLGWNIDDVPHTIRIACSPDNGVTLIEVGGNSTPPTAPGQPYQVQKWGSLLQGESLWIWMDEVTNSLDPVVRFNYVDVPA